MKPLYWGLGLLTAVLVLCLGAAARLSADSRQTEALLQSAFEAAAAGEEDLATAYAERARRVWDAAIPFIDAVTSHEETDEVNRSFAELLTRAQTGQWEEFLAGCARLRVMTAHLRRMERASWYNILSAPAIFVKMPLQPQKFPVQYIMRESLFPDAAAVRYRCRNSCGPKA